MTTPLQTPAPLTVSVRALCAFTARTGDLDLRFTPAPSALEGMESHRLVQGRRDELVRNQALQVPDTIRDWEAVLEQDTSLTGQPAEGLLRGIAVSAGTTTGPVRIVRSTQDWPRVRPGDILVVPVIDPGMAPLFGVAGGVIAEMGGTLSHGAIIAREYGLPVLVNVPYATTRLRENEQVKIESSTGAVSRLVP